MRGSLTATNLFGFASLAIAFVTTPVIAQEQPNPDRNVYFGDTHGLTSEFVTFWQR